MIEPERRRGRRRTYDAERTRETILNAAETLFAEKGFDGTSMDIIASQSGYNKSLIFQYFGDKTGLYSQVLKRSDQEMSALMGQAYDIIAAWLANENALLQAEEFKAFLVAMMGSIFDYLLEHPRLVRILNWEMAAGWKTFATVASQFAPEDQTRMQPLFQRACEAGLLRSDFAPLIQFSMMIPWCQIYLSYLPLYQQIFPGENLAFTDMLANTREYLVEFVVSGIMNYRLATTLENKEKRGQP